ncbi:MAG: sulfur carrier protein ThiS [Sulfurospirillaceae bacterium]|nr:sulfur carrier protein ThiS [Sulfurospirillaceae bacterium]MDD3463263.1 sulfur carrier protein ThiS [Sulfurospirillaceae bacterium]
MILVVNGEEKEVLSQNVYDLMVELGIEEKVMAVAVNMDIVKKENWKTFELNANDRVEFLQFVGGG